MLRIQGKTVEMLRSGTDYHDWRLGIQLAIDGKVAPMFDLHKSRIREVSDYESLLVECAETLLRQMGPQRPGIPPASPR